MPLPLAHTARRVAADVRAQAYISTGAHVRTHACTHAGTHAWENATAYSHSFTHAVDAHIRAGTTDTHGRPRTRTKYTDVCGEAHARTHASTRVLAFASDPPRPASLVILPSLPHNRACERDG
eukprot:4533900-Pleurochrysis_carterae.AAC.4